MTIASVFCLSTICVSRDGLKSRAMTKANARIRMAVSSRRNAGGASPEIR